METLTSIQFWLYFHFFFIAIVLSVLLPGILLLKKLEFQDNSTKLIVGFVVGLVLWSAQGYLFGYLHLRLLTYLYVILAIYLSIKNLSYISQVLTASAQSLLVLPKSLLYLVTIGVIVQVLPVFGSGLRFKEGVRFFGVNGADGVMHLGFIQSIVKNFPPEQPGALGNQITNYHYWSDLFFAELVRVWQIPTSYIFFQYAPLVISLVTAISLYKLLKIWTNDFRVHLAGLFFLFFAGDAAYSLILILHQNISFHTPAIDNGISQFLNMPHAMAKMIFFTGLLVFQYWIKTKEKIYGLLSFCLFASLAGFKVYFAIYSIVGIGSLLFFTFLSSWFKANRIELKYIKNAKNVIRDMFPLIGLTLIFFVLFLLIFLPPNKNAGGLFYSPLEWSKILLGSSGINFTPWWNFYYKFTSSGNTLGLIFLNFIAIIITLISIHGTRAIGFFMLPRNYKILGKENTAFLLPALLIFHLLGLTTLQSSGGLNVFNFFAVSTSILAIFSAFVLVDLSKNNNKLLATSFALLLILSTVPRGLYEIYSYSKDYITKDNSYVISNNELEALYYIRKNSPKDFVVQSLSSNHLDRRVPYIAYFTDRSTYLSGVELQQTHNQPIDERIKDVDIVFNAPNSFDFFKKLNERNIDLLYFQKNQADQDLLFQPEKGHFEVFFENEDVLVYDPINGL